MSNMHLMARNYFNYNKKIVRQEKESGGDIFGFSYRLYFEMFDSVFK